MRLLLIRHGRTLSNVKRLLDTAAPGAPLDEVGLGQAASLVERLAGTPLEAIYASDRTRTQETAAPLAVAHDLPVTVLPGLGEIMAGEDEMSPDWHRYIEVLTAWGTGTPEAMIDGGEDAATFFERFDAAVAAIAATGHQTAALVSHGAALRTWVSGRVRGVRSEDMVSGVLGNTAVLDVVGAPDTGWDLLRWDPGVDS
ncbi:MAG: histidine phosphatase family protein [Propioniciclava sp.]